MEAKEVEDKEAVNELVHYRWDRFKKLIGSHFEVADKQLEESGDNLENAIGAVMDALEALRIHRSRLHHALSRKARRHGIDPGRAGWGFHKREGLSEEVEQVSKLIEDNKQ